ncbi:Beta-galactosidase, partial [Streptomyces venezuelae ATCC 10712]
MTNGHDVADLAHLAFTWSFLADGEPLAEGPLEVPALAAGESARVMLPAPPAHRAGAETVWTVRAVLARDTAWAAAGHEVAWGQLTVQGPAPRPSAATARAVRAADRIALGPGVFDAATGVLTALGPLPVTAGPRLDVWRAPTDNDEGAPWQPDERHGPLWRALGLHRMRHRTDEVVLDGGALTVRSRVAPAASDLGLRTTYRWTSDGTALRLGVEVEPEGDWRVPLPRLGVLLGLPAALDRAEWYGAGPGEAYPDTRAAARLGRWAAPVDALHTPYLRPQENGARIDTRWLRLGGETGGVRVEGEPAFAFTARRWTTERLAAAAHRGELVPGDTIWLHLDHAQHGIGSQSCGPGVLPEYRLDAAPAAFSLTFTPLGRPPAPGPLRGRGSGHV